MVTEEELRELNKAVYQVYPNYEDNGKIKYSDKENSDLKDYERNSITLGNQKFKVLSVKNGDYGFQGMAVAPIINDIPDVSQVTVVAAGTYPKDGGDLKAAVKGMAPNESL